MERNYQPILRRDPAKMKSISKYVSAAEKLLFREEGTGEISQSGKAKKLAYLAKLGITPKKEAAWDISHMKAGDQFAGFVEHPEMGRLDVKVEVKSQTEAYWYSRNKEFEGAATIVQDHPFAAEGPQRKLDIAGYIFSKFNMRWRNFEEPAPSFDDVQYLDLEGLQFFFKLCASVENYPPQDMFNEACADPSKGMTREEFVAFTDDPRQPEYLDEVLPTFYTGRRIKIFDSQLELEGDFSTNARGYILGFVSYLEEDGGKFQLTLAKW
jgi:hypothetical protein